MPRNVYPLNTRRDLIFPDVRGTVLDDEEPYTEDMFRRFSQSTTTTWIVDRMIMALANLEYQASIERIRLLRGRTRARVARQRAIHREMRARERADGIAAAERRHLSIGRNPAALDDELARHRAEYEAEQESRIAEEIVNEDVSDEYSFDEAPSHEQASDYEPDLPNDQSRDGTSRYHPNQDQHETSDEARTRNGTEHDWSSQMAVMAHRLQEQAMSEAQERALNAARLRR